MMTDRKREALSVMPALMVYLALELFGAPALVALGATVAVMAAGLGWLARHGGLTRMSLLSSAVFIIIAVVVSVTGNVWLFLLKPVATGVILGTVIVVNAERGTRPYSLRILCRVRPRRREGLLHQYENDPVARQRHHTATKVWGVAVIIDGLARAVALLALPPWLAVITSMPLTIVTLAVGVPLTLRYLSTPPRSHDLYAASPVVQQDD